jgi:hypothetical protein
MYVRNIETIVIIRQNQYNLMHRKYWYISMEMMPVKSMLS